MAEVALTVLSTWYPSSPGSPRSPRSPDGPYAETNAHINTHTVFIYTQYALHELAQSLVSLDVTVYASLNLVSRVSVLESHNTVMLWAFSNRLFDMYWSSFDIRLKVA